MAAIPKGLGWPKLVLASASPRRAELLRQVGADFVIRPTLVDERNGVNGSPEELSVGLAKLKAEASVRALRGRLGGRVILAADTVVSYRYHLLGKPENDREASRMLRLLSGRTHQVITGVCLAGPGGHVMTGHEASSVRFRRLSPAMVRWYVSTGEPQDKAGAYGIQGRGALLVKRVEGCYFNVVGLPLGLLDRMLAKFTRLKA